MSSGEIKAGEAYVEIGAALDGLQAGLANAEAQVSSAVARMSKIGGGLIIGGAAIAAGLGAAVKQAADLESAMVEVRKVTSEATARGLREDIRALSREVPIAAEKLAQLAADAARFGIEGRENIREFVEVTAMMGAAFDDIEPARAARMMAKLSGLADFGTSQMEGMASAINTLGNDFKTNSAEIMEAMLRSSATLSQFGMRATDIAAVNAAMNESAHSAERAGTWLTRLASQLMSPDAVKRVSDALGITSQQFRQLRQAAPVATMRLLAQKMAEGGKTARRLRGALSEVSLKALRGLSQNLDRVTEAQKESNKEAAKGTSIQKEFDLAASTLYSRLTILGNRIEDVAVAIGEPLIGSVKAVITIFSDLFAVVGKMVKAVPGLSTVFAWVATALITLGSALLITAGSMGIYTAATWAATAATTAFNAALTWLKAHPIVAAISAITGLGLAIAWKTGLLGKATEALHNYTEGMKEGTEQAKKQKEETEDLARSIEDIEGKMEKARQKLEEFQNTDVSNVADQFDDVKDSAEDASGALRQQAEERERFFQRGRGEGIASGMRRHLIQLKEIRKQRQKATEDFLQARLKYMKLRERRGPEPPASRGRLSRVEKRIQQLMKIEELVAQTQIQKLGQLWQAADIFRAILQPYRERISRALGGIVDTITTEALQSPLRLATELIDKLGSGQKSLWQLARRRQQIEQQIRKSAQRGNVERIRGLRKSLDFVEQMQRVFRRVLGFEIPKMGKDMDRAAQRAAVQFTGVSRGTFSAVGAERMVAATEPIDRVADATEQTAQNTEELRRRVRNQRGLRYS